MPLNWPEATQTRRFMTLHTNCIICLLAKWSLRQKGCCPYIIYISVCVGECVCAHVWETFPQGKYILNDKQPNVNYPYHHILHACRLSLLTRTEITPARTPPPPPMLMIHTYLPHPPNHIQSIFNSYSLHSCSLNPPSRPGTFCIKEH